MTMLAKLLHICQYEEDGWTNTTQDIADPTWDEVEQAVRRLDKFRYPYIRLGLQPDFDEQGMFDIMGGDGDYWIGASIHGWLQRRYFDPGQGDEQIILWISDQGFADQAKYVCYDIEVVLKAAKCFCEKGDFEPTVPWEPER